MKLQITIDGRAYAVDVELMEEEEAAQPQEALNPPVTQTQSLARAELNTDPNVCRSPVNGLVFKVNVAPGQSVETGAVIVILEAMKMETNIVTPRAATVKAVYVKPGDPVKTNQILVELE